MLEIKRSSVEFFISPLLGDGEVSHVSLFVVCKNNCRLKKLNLDGLSQEERLSTLHFLGEEHRFVLVIEKGDHVFAHVHSIYANQLQHLDSLSLNNRKVNVIVKSISDEEAHLISLIGQEFEKHVVLEQEQGKDEKESLAKDGVQDDFLQNFKCVEKNSVALYKQLTSTFNNQKLKSYSKLLISQCIRRLEEARQELQERMQADDIYFDIKKTEIKRGLRRSETKNEEVNNLENQIENKDTGLSHRTLFA